LLDFSRIYRVSTLFPERNLHLVVSTVFIVEIQPLNFLIFSFFTPRPCAAHPGKMH
jgi:hypothetical protein